MKRLLLLALMLSARLPAADLTLLPSGAAGRLLVPTNGAVATNWIGRTFDESGWTAVVLPVGFDVVPAPVRVETVLADSVSGFSGVQGSNGWSYGYYHRGADANSSYDPTTEFIATDPNFDFLDGAWQLGAGGNVGANPPWVSIRPLDLHPNSSGGEHWVIRRYTCAAAGRVRIAGVLGNVSGLGSTTARIVVDGTLVYSAAVGAQGFGYSVIAAVNAGSKIDFALDPNGSDASDTTRWTAILHPATEGAAVAADSTAGFSGVQGASRWHYGFYNRTLDANGHYDAATDFNSSDPRWSYRGGEWALAAEDPPWSALGALHVHPNGVNDGEEHWVIRRWVSPVTGPVTVDWHFAKEIPYGEGASLRVLHNGALVDQLTVAGDDRLGALRSRALQVRAGDFLDFACTPVGPDGDDGDGADRCVFRAVIYANPIHPGAVCTPVADSRADWNTNGQQGYRGWFHGYYNRSADVTPGFQPGEFIPFPNEGTGWSRTNFWRGTDWDWNPDLTPWDNLGQTAAHPNGTNNGAEHWVIRRWVSSVSGRVRVNWFTRKSNPFGSGVTGQLLHNGVEQDSASLAAGDFTGVNRTVDLPGVSVGDRIDLVLTPVGPTGAADDSGDGSANGMSLATCQAVADAVTTDIANALRPPGVTALLRVPFQVAETSGLKTVTLRMKYDDGFVAWLNGVEIARRNVAGGTGASGESSTPVVECRSVSQALTEEALDVTPFRSALVKGLNVLAIQGWNCRVDDARFLLGPELSATTNRPPIAGADGFATVRNQPATVSPAQLLSNDHDPDGDAVSLLEILPRSARGGGVTLAEGAVTYTPPPGFTGLDMFSYTAVDGRGGSAAGAVQVLVVTGSLPAPNQLLLSATTTGYHLRFAGISGRGYEIQRSADLVAWTTLDRMIVPLHGLIELEDSTGGISTFYRAVLTP